MRVLVVEDNEAIADALKRGLAAEGSDVYVAGMIPADLSESVDICCLLCCLACGLDLVAAKGVP